MNIAKVLYDISNKKEYLEIFGNIKLSKKINIILKATIVPTLQGKFISTPIFKYIGVMGKATRYQKSKLFIKS